MVILFGLYLVTLTLMPCADVLDQTQPTGQASYLSQKHTESSEHCDQEGCAPFCSCNCCAIGKHFPLQTTITIIEPVAQITYPTCSTSAVKKQVIAIWQPPKLA